MLKSLDLFRLDGKVAVVTAGTGVLCSAIARGYAQAGAAVAIASRDLGRAEALVQEIEAAGGRAHAYALDVFERESLQVCADGVAAELGGIDILVNGVGGNMTDATTAPDLSFFDLKPEAFERIVDFNLVAGTVLPSQIFGQHMVRQAHGGVILNISSMSADRPLTRIAGYSAAKAAVDNFTQWLAVHLAKEYSPALRVNAVAPGFFLTEQNRFLLLDAETGAATPRGEAILAHTPMGRYGAPDDLVGTAIWLASDAARFVTGIVVPVDGGFSAYSGV